MHARAQYLWSILLDRRGRAADGKRIRKELGIIESFEPKSTKPFELKVRAGKQTDELRPQIEGILRRYNLDFELRTSSDEEVSYDVAVPLEIKTDRVTNAILRLDPDGHAAVDWTDKKKAK